MRLYVLGGLHHGCLNTTAGGVCVEKEGDETREWARMKGAASLDRHPDTGTASAHVHYQQLPRLTKSHAS